MASLQNIAIAIARQEGWYKIGSVPSRNNNPGNLKLGPRTKRFRGTTKDNQGHAIFPTPKDGFGALEDLLRSKASGQSLAQIGKWYAEDPNWARGVSKLAGVDVDEPLTFDDGALPSGTPPPPTWLKLALAEVGVKELPGAPSNPVVEKYYEDAGNSGRVTDDVPWCAAFVGAMLKRAGIKPSGSLMARSYLNWGDPISTPRVGAVVVFSRGAPPSGHVAIVLKDEGRTVQVVGGNQRDAVTVTSYPKSRILGYRWPTTSRRSMSMAKSKAKSTGRTRPRRYGAPTIVAPPTILAEVPVVNPNATAANSVGIAAVITPLILYIAAQYNVPLTPEQLALIFGALNVMTGLFVWIKNRWYTAEATTTTAELRGLKFTVKYNG